MDRFSKAIEEKGSGDYSLEVFGWNKLREEFIPLADTYEKAGLMQADAPIVSYRWFPAANLDYYAARGSKRYVLAAGDTNAIHKYAWINQIHGGFKLNTDAWYITSSRDFRHPLSLPYLYYTKIFPPDTIHIQRMGKEAYSFYIFRLKNLQALRN
jgi:hypothetical protein